MVNLHQRQPSNQGEAAQILQDQLDHQQFASNQNQILPDQSHHNPLRENTQQQAQDQNALKQTRLKQDQLDEGSPDEGSLDEVDLKDVALDESKLDPRERQVSKTQRYAPGPDHATPAQQNQDHLNLEKHTSNEQVEEAKKEEQANKNPQVPGNQQHQSPGSEPLNNVKQQQGIDTLIDNT